MLYLFGLVFAALIVAGNSLYKLAVDRQAFEATASYLLSKKMVGFLTSWEFLAGLLLFGAASLVSFYMLSRYQFSTIQVVTVPVVMALSYVVGSWLFKDQITSLNVIGLLILVAGVILASIK